MQWRDSDQPIPDGDEVRALVAAYESIAQAQPPSC
jgi:hypothetical protein